MRLLLPRLLVLTAALLTTVWGHPMGNYSVSHYSRLTLRPGGADVTYVLDLAEIPTFELLQQWGMDFDTPREQINGKVTAQAREWVRALRITTADGKPVAGRVTSVDLDMQPGAGNMPVMRVTSHFRVAAEPGVLTYEDPNFEQRSGWKEIVVYAGQGTAIAQSSVPIGEERSQGLTAYPADPKVSPPIETKVSLTWTGPAMSPVPTPAPAPAAPPVVVTKHVEAPVVSVPTAPKTQQPTTSPTLAQQQQAPGTVQRGDYLSQLLGQKQLSLGLMLTGLGVAFVFGAMHAISPGHGKTLVAAYLVGTRGTAMHALFLGAMVTFTHTVSVFALGLATMFLSAYFLPDNLYKVLGAISGLSIVAVGAMLVYKRSKALARLSYEEHLQHLQQRRLVHSHDGVVHSHSPEHEHDEDDSVHTHDGHTHSHVPEGPVSIGSLIALGASGGLVPCPSALVLLLSAVSLGRAGFGLMLLVSFSLGLAVVLTGIGLAVVYAKHLLPERTKTATHPLLRLVPVLSAAAVTVIGLVMTGISLGWIKPVAFLS